MVGTAPSLSRLQVRHWGLVAAVAAVAGLVGVQRTAGVLIGGSVIGLVVVAYSAAARAVLRRGRPGLAVGLLFAKLAAFLGLAWIAFASGTAYRPDPIGFALGLSCFPVAAVWEAMWARGG